MPLSKKANPEQNLSDQESGVLLDAAKKELAKIKDEGWMPQVNLSYSVVIDEQKAELQNARLPLIAEDDNRKKK